MKALRMCSLSMKNLSTGYVSSTTRENMYQSNIFITQRKQTYKHRIFRNRFEPNRAIQHIQEVFFYRCSLVKYLLQLNDVKTDYSQYDEPMTISANVLKQCQKLGIPCEFPPLKLKSGSGEHVLLVLNGLANKAMKRKNFNFKKPNY